MNSRRSHLFFATNGRKRDCSGNVFENSHHFVKSTWKLLGLHSQSKWFIIPLLCKIVLFLACYYDNDLQVFILHTTVIFPFRAFLLLNKVIYLFFGAELIQMSCRQHSPDASRVSCSCETLPLT